ncbi:Endoglycoceramidase [Geodia barretti]|uniref:Endoglycoceramidase n=1 Tax=Geodia barretti TaxID=519541 RepID=A0AA35RR11_GEOBA|nr:Endoglycoceramidase [Geodia barretti]
MLRFLLLFTAAFCVSSSSRASPGSKCLHVNNSTHRIVDTDGRERYFHGVNVVVKGPPWLPELQEFDPLKSFVEKDMQTLQELGLNAIRYGMMWPGAEPEKGVFNETYFTLSEDLINTAGSYGIYTLLDMHQDVLSDKFCGEGIPDWAVDTGNAKGFPYPVDEPYKVDPTTGYPTPEDCAKHAWADYQFAEASSAAYQNLYNNSNGLLTSWANFWGKVAQVFADNEYILGYELINEPWAGDIYDHPKLLIPGVADEDVLAPAYEVLNKEIRKYDECHSVYFESVTWDELTVGFKQPPGGFAYANRSVLSYHFYTPPQISADITFAERQKDLERLKCAGFLTEFEIGLPDYKTMADTDEYLQGSGSSIWYDNGTMNMQVVDRLSRTYAHSVAGVTTLMLYNEITKRFTLTYYVTAACTSNTTEIYFNKALHYSQGYTVAVAPSNSVTWKEENDNYVIVSHSRSLPEGALIDVSISSST